MNWGIELAERGWAPDLAIRMGIRRLLRKREAFEAKGDCASRQEATRAFVRELRSGPLAISTRDANAQHYEVPTEYFRLALGPRLKYSSCLWPDGVTTLGDAEERMLALTCERAGLADGQRILELGCGWGSLSLWMAERYPQARITAVSNSATQREFIEGECRRLGLGNLTVLTRDMNVLELDSRFDRVVSVEMFEHMRNYDLLFRKIAGWLEPDGKLFAHIFCHRTLLYPFETEGEGNWMGRHFFTGGLMPAADTLLWFQDALRIEDRWLVDGTHYRRTANQWLRNQDTHRAELMPILREAYGDAAPVWFQRWRMFWMACAELFGYGHGREWMVAHYRFAKEAA